MLPKPPSARFGWLSRSTNTAARQALLITASNSRTRAQPETSRHELAAATEGNEAATLAVQEKRLLHHVFALSPAVPRKDNACARNTRLSRRHDNLLQLHPPQ